MILVTGGLGYLGGRIVSYFIDSGQTVRIASSRIKPEIPEQFSSCEIVYINFNDSITLENACDKVSFVIHLAGLNAKESKEDAKAALFVNGLGTLKLLEAAEKKGVSRFLFFSTIHVYGFPLVDQIEESLLPLPIDQYSITNRLAEDYVLSANRNKKLKGAVIRLSNAVGKPVIYRSNCWSLVVNDLCHQAIKLKSLKINSDGRQSRDFIAIKDICNAMEFIMTLPNKKFRGEIFNLGGTAHTIYEIALLIAERYYILFGFKLKIETQVQVKSKELSDKFVFSTRKLDKLGLVSKNHLIFEIDQLLKYCDKNSK